MFMYINLLCFKDFAMKMWANVHYNDRLIYKISYCFYA